MHIPYHRLYKNYILLYLCKFPYSNKKFDYAIASDRDMQHIFHLVHKKYKHLVLYKFQSLN